MLVRFALSVSLLLWLSPVLADRSPAAELPDDADGLAAAARSALDGWKYEDAAEALGKLAKSAPADGRLIPLRIEFLARIGRAEEAAELAKAADAALAGKLPLEVALKVGRGLAAAGQEAAARKWILASARRAGRGQAARAADSLTALLAPRGGEGLVTEFFAGEMASTEAERAEAVKAYKAIVDALKGELGEGPSAAPLRLAHYAARRRLEELLDEGGASGAPRSGPADRSRLLWQVPVGIDEQPEQAAVADGLVLVAGRAGGQSLPGLPLADRLRAFDLKTGAQRWSLELAPKIEEAGAGGLPGGLVSYCGRAAGLAAAGGRAYVLVKTERFERRGGSRTGSFTAATLLAVDLASGKRAWIKDAPRMADRLYRVGDRLVAAGFRNLAGHALADGAELWNQELERALSGDGAVAGGGLVLPGWREIASLDPSSGNVKWTVPRAGGTSAVIRKCLSDGTLVAFGETEKEKGTDTIRLLDGASGKAVWTRSFSFPSTEGGELDLALAGTALVVSRGAVVRALSARDGNAAWRTVLPAPGGGSDARVASAGAQALWCGGGMLVGLDPADGKPAWWGPGPSRELRPLEAALGPGPVLALAGLTAKSLCAWRADADEPGTVAARREAARKLSAVAEKLAAAGQPQAAARLFEIGRSYALPGSLEVELAALRQEGLADRAGAAFAERGLFLSALAAAAGGADKDAAAKLAGSILERADAAAGHKVLAAAALTILGDAAGPKYLAANPAAWSGKPELMPAVLCASRAAGGGAAPILIAGLTAAGGAARAQLVEHLAAHKSPEVRSAIEKLLTDPDRNVRMAAAGTLFAVAGMEALDTLDGAYKREEDPVARERLRDLLAALGHRPAMPMPRPTPLPPDVRPEPTPGPSVTLTKEAALEKLAKEGKVLWSKADVVVPALTWIAVEKKFVFLHSSADGSLTGFADFIKLVGRIDVTVAELAAGTEMIWAATDRGAFCYDRRARAWSQIVINLDMDLVEANVEKAELTEQGVAFTVKGRGRFEFNTKTRKWSKG